jgi:hypothetical protein
VNVVPLGGEFPVAVDASKGQVGFSVAYDGTNYLVGLMYYDNGGTVCGGDFCRYARGQFVDADGHLVGSQINVGLTGGAPQVGFDGSSYLMIYETGMRGQESEGDIYGVSISTTGVAGTPFLIAGPSAGADRRQELNVRNMAFDASNNLFLVVWEDQRAGTDTDFSPRIYGRLVSANGTVGDEFIITSKRGQVPSVAFDGTRYLVAWTDETKIWGQFVTAAGVLSNASFVIDPVSKTYADPSNMPLIVGFDGTRHTVSYGEKINAADWRFWVRPVSAVGAKGARKKIYEGQTATGCFVTAGDGLAYLVACSQVPAGGSPVMATRYLNGNFDPVGEWVTIFETAGNKIPIGGFSLFDGAGYFMVATRATLNQMDGFTDGEVYGRFLDKSGCIYTLRPALKNFPFNGGAVVVNVTSPFSCSVPEITEDYDWISGSVLNWNTSKGSGVIKFTAVRNTSSAKKPAGDFPGIITVGGEPFLVTLAGKPCAITGLLPASQPVPNTGGDYSLAVRVDPTDCEWQASTAFSWLHIGAADPAADTLAYTVDANTGAGAVARTGTITVSLTETPLKKKIATIRQAK